MKIQGMVAGGLTLLAVVFSSGCGGAGGASTFQPSQTQALQIAADLLDATAGASVNSNGTIVGLHAPGMAAHVRSATLNENPEAVTAPESATNRLASPYVTPVTIVITPFTFSCSAGGSVTVSGSVSDTDTGTQNSPNIVLSETVTEMINKCNDGTITLNGNPSVTLTGTTSLIGTVLTETATIAGGVTANNTNCPINLTIHATANTANNTSSGSVSGSVCGVNISGSF